MKGFPFINTPIHRGGPGHSDTFQPFQWFPGFHEYARRSTPNRLDAELQRLLDIYPQLIHHQVALVTMSLANPIRSALASATLLCAATQCLAQGTVTFDGPPVQPPGTAYVVQSYHEAGLWFVPILGTDGFVRRGSYSRPFWPDNGSAYVEVGLGDSLVFGMLDGSDFSLMSVDLAEWSTDYPQSVRVHFVGYRRDGTTVTTDLLTDGIMDGTGPLSDFQSLYFGPEFSGVYEVEIPTIAQIRT